MTISITLDFVFGGGSGNYMGNAFLIICVTRLHFIEIGIALCSVYNFFSFSFFFLLEIVGHIIGRV